MRGISSIASVKSGGFGRLMIEEWFAKKENISDIIEIDEVIGETEKAVKARLVSKDWRGLKGHLGYEKIGWVPKSLLSPMQSAVNSTTKDVKTRAPAIIKKAVRNTYKNQKPSDKALKPLWHENNSKSGYASFSMRLRGLSITYKGELHAVQLSGIKAPFSNKGPYGHRKTGYSAKGASKYGKQWTKTNVPWLIKTPLGTANFGENKRNLFAIPSQKNSLPLLFRRRPGKNKNDVEIIKTTSVPQEIRLTEKDWRKGLDELVAKRLAHNLERFGIAKK